VLVENYILPKWGEHAITDVKARPVEQWLESLKLSPKSRSHVRGLLHKLWAFAMWIEVVPVQVNPRSLTVEEFRKFVRLLGEPFRTIALIGVCFGLRISECLALKWSDVDWLSGKLSIERGIVRQRVDDVKTIYSGRDMSIDAEMIGVLKDWRQSTQFASQDDWVFASPVKLGRQPWSYDQVWRSFLKASESAGVGKLGTHTMRHTYRSWLDAVGTPIAVQQNLMRHGDIRTTMNTYGDVVTDEMSQAHIKVVRMALSSTN
jgi:integrase